MRFILLFTIICATSYGQQPTSLSQARALVRELNGKLTETQTELTLTRKTLQETMHARDEASSQVEGLGKVIDGLKHEVTVQTERADREHKEAQRNARERDIFVILMSILGAVAILPLLGPLLKNLTPPWGLVAQIAAPVVVFFVCYSGIRAIVSLLVTIIYT